MTAPQLSPGLEWWWTGSEWVPAADHPDGRAALAAATAAPVPAPLPMAVPPVMPAQTRRLAPVPALVSAPVPSAVPSVAPTAPAVVAAPVALVPAAVEPDEPTPPAQATVVEAPKPLPDSPYAPGRPAGLIETFGPPPPPSKLPERLRMGGIAAGVLVVTITGITLLTGGSDAPPPEPSAIDRREFAVQAAVEAETLYWVQHSTYTRTEAGLREAGYAGVVGVTTTVPFADKKRYCLRLAQGSQVLFYDSRTQQVGPKSCA